MIKMNIPPTDNLMVPLRDMLGKTTGQLTVQDVLSLAFHTVQDLGKRAFRGSSEWNELYTSHLDDLRKQTVAKWPKPMIRTNRLYTRRDLDTLSHSFLRTNNFLTLLLRLLYLEVIKNATNYTGESINVLDIKPFDDSILEPVKELTVARIFYLIRMALIKYVRVYNDAGTFENDLGMSILSALTAK